MKENMTTTKEYFQYLVSQITKAGTVSVKYDNNGAVVSDTVSIWVDTEAKFIEITSVFLKGYHICINGLDDNGCLLTNVPIEKELDRIEEFISMYISDYIPYKSSHMALMSDIISDYERYCAKFNKQIELLLVSIGKGKITVIGDSVYMEKGEAVAEDSLGGTSKSMSSIIAVLKKCLTYNKY